MISDDYCNIGKLLLLTIIVNSKNWTISIIVKEDITVNRQNRLIAHPNCVSELKFISWLKNWNSYSKYNFHSNALD